MNTIDHTLKKKNLEDNSPFHLILKKKKKKVQKIEASLVAQLVKNLLAMQKTQVQFLDWEDPLEKETATHSSIRAWRIPWTGEPGKTTVHGVTQSRTRLSN